MNQSKIEVLRETFTTGKHQFECAAKLVKNLKAGEEPHCNDMLYHLTVAVKCMLKIVCMRFGVEYCNSYSLETLFDKTEQHLPANILEMREDVLYWHYHVQYEAKNVKSEYEACEIARTLERFFNEFIRPNAIKTKESLDSSWHVAAHLKPLDMFS